MILVLKKQKNFLLVKFQEKQKVALELLPKRRVFVCFENKNFSLTKKTLCFFLLFLKEVDWLYVTFFLFVLQVITLPNRFYFEHNESHFYVSKQNKNFHILFFIRPKQKKRSVFFGSKSFVVTVSTPITKKMFFFFYMKFVVCFFRKEWFWEKNIFFFAKNKQIRFFYYPNLKAKGATKIKL